VIAESRREQQETQFYNGHEERNQTIQAWLEIASRQELTDIWGDPYLNEDTLRWEIPSENNQYVSGGISMRGEAYCYYFGIRQFTFVVEEPRVKTPDSERIITRQIKLGSSTFKRKE